jgi:hypothetical protein
MSARRKSDPREVVLAAAIRVDVNLTTASSGTTRGFGTWGDACAWLASFLAARGPDVSSVRIVHQAAQAGGAR